MTFDEAQKAIDDNKHLIGKKFRGAKIDEFLIVPTDKKLFEIVQRVYVDTLDAQKAILPYVNYDVEVLAICGKQHIRQNSVFPYTILSDLLRLSNEIE